MKKLSLLVTLLVVFTVAANAQEYKKFKVGVGAGFALPGGSGAKGGVLFGIEPAYRLTDNIAIGLRWEAAAVVRGASETISSDVDLEVAGISSYTLNGNYYFMEGNFRPFVGAGLGIYSLAAVDYSVDGSSTQEAVEAGSKFGFYPRVGFDAGHFTLNIDFNLIPQSDIAGADVAITNNYIGFRLGGYFGGGRK